MLHTNSSAITTAQQISCMPPKCSESALKVPWKCHQRMVRIQWRPFLFDFRILFPKTVLFIFFKDVLQCVRILKVICFQISGRSLKICAGLLRNVDMDSILQFEGAWVEKVALELLWNCSRCHHLWPILNNQLDWGISIRNSSTSPCREGGGGGEREREGVEVPSIYKI